MEWQNGKPPNETLVEVEFCGEIIEVIAFFGRDGYLPHWRTLEGCTCWPPSEFRRWRHIEKKIFEPFNLLHDLNKE